MTVYEIIGSILLIISCVLVTITVLLQSSKADGMAALGGKSSGGFNAEAKSNEAKLCRMTKYLAIAFFVITILVYAATIYLK